MKYDQLAESLDNFGIGYQEISKLINLCFSLDEVELGDKLLKLKSKLDINSREQFSSKEQIPLFKDHGIDGNHEDIIKALFDKLNMKFE